MDAEPERETRSFRDRLSQSRPGERAADSPSGPGDSPISRLVWRDVVEEELEPVRHALRGLETTQNQDRDALRAASSGWAEQIVFGPLVLFLAGLAPRAVTMTPALAGLSCQCGLLYVIVVLVILARLTFECFD